MGQTKKMPVRTCTGCRQAKNKKDLIRVVRDKEGNVSVDATGKLNGRGAYICPDKQLRIKVWKKHLRFQVLAKKSIVSLKKN